MGGTTLLSGVGGCDGAQDDAHKGLATEHTQPMFVSPYLRGIARVHQGKQCNVVLHGSEMRSSQRLGEVQGSGTPSSPLGSYDKTTSMDPFSVNSESEGKSLPGASCLMNFQELLQRHRKTLPDCITTVTYRAKSLQDVPFAIKLHFTIFSSLMP